MKNNKGITMISLVITVLVLLLVTGVIIHNGKNYEQIKELNKLYADIDSISTKVADYYLNNGTLPVLNEKYVSNQDDFKVLLTINGARKIDEAININDEGAYYVIDLSKLDNLTLNYGEDYKKWPASQNTKEVNNLYIINAFTHQIYFPHGIECKSKKYFSKNTDNNIVTPVELDSINTDLEVKLTNFLTNDLDDKISIKADLSLLANTSLGRSLNNYNFDNFEYAWSETNSQANDSSLSYTKFIPNSVNETLANASITSKPLNTTEEYFYLYLKLMDNNGEYNYKKIPVLAGPITGWNSTYNVNFPKLATGMIPIKWNGSKWVVCSTSDVNWFKYGTTASTKQWANVMLSDGTYKADSVEVGTVVEEKDLGSMYVWIPRYAYQMPANSTTTKGTIDITFLMRTTNKDKDGTLYIKPTATTNTETTKIVHPAFTLGEEELTGIWVAKFESSGTNSAKLAVGNATKDGNNGNYDPVEYEPGVTIAKSLPNVPSWRNITQGEAEYQSIAIAGINKEKYGLDNCSSHLIKNTEWGAVAYLCYSNYGNVPKINGCGSETTKNSSWYYDLYTGQGPKTNSDESRYEYTSSTIANHGYSTENGMLASTTGNITGIYDMNGGAWERVAAYLDNGNEYLNSYGKSTSHTSVKYFEGGALKSEYSSLWDSYEVSDEEKNNQIEVTLNGSPTTISQEELWNVNKTSQTYVEARKRITDANYNNMAKHKGIGVNEVSSVCSFYTPFEYKKASNETARTWGWFKNVATVMSRASGTSTANEYATSWDGDLVGIGHASYPFVIRGGVCYSSSNAGVFYSRISGGGAHYSYGFRSVVVL